MKHTLLIVLSMALSACGNAAQAVQAKTETDCQTQAKAIVNRCGSPEGITSSMLVFRHGDDWTFFELTMNPDGSCNVGSYFNKTCKKAGCAIEWTGNAALECERPQ